MADAGWYPDPGGQQGMYRYWDGHAWSAVTTANPSTPPPNQGLGQGSGAPGAYGQSQGQSYGNASQPTAYQAYQQQSKKRSTVGWWIGGLVVLVVLIIIGVLIIRNLGGGGALNPGGGDDGTSNPCPTTSSSPSGDSQHPADGRVHGGPISYPALPAPWSEARPPSNPVPFGTDSKQQDITIEPNYQPNSSWVASVLVAQLIAGDGFFTPKEGAQIVAKCVVGAFYGDNPVDRHDQVSKAMKVDGHEAWYLQSHLTFDIEGLKAKGETMTIVIINAGATSGLYYASIPDNAKQYQADADRALEGVTVDK